MILMVMPQVTRGKQEVGGIVRKVWSRKWEAWVGQIKAAGRLPLAVDLSLRSIVRLQSTLPL
jgi:hypothetical protein